MKHLLLLVIIPFILSACYEDTDVIIHEAGEYKGKIDRHALSAEQRAVVLEQRFNQVQTDR